jgi:hypothetical protein
LVIVLHEDETWCLILKERHGLRVYGNKLMRRVFGPRRKDVTGGWRRLQNEKLHNSNSSPDIIMVIN